MYASSSEAGLLIDPDDMVRNLIKRKPTLLVYFEVETRHPCNCIAAVWTLCGLIALT